MIGSLSAELLKLGKRPATWVLLGAWLVLNLVFSYVLPYSGYLTGTENQQTQGLSPGDVLAGVLPGELVSNAIGGFPVFGGAIFLIFGALASGSEYAWETLKTALTQRPSRLRLFGGKLLALAVSMLAAVLVTFAVDGLVGAAIAAVESQPMDWPAAADLAAGAASGWLILTMWCALGALLGFATRSVALPVGLGVVWVLGVENLVSSVAGSLLTSLQALRDVLPGVNAGSLVWSVTAQAVGEPPPGVVDAVSGTRAAVTLAAYLALFAVAGAALLRRRDVT